MAALRGGVNGDHRNGSTATRLSSNNIDAWVNTWGERAIVHMKADGSGSFTLQDETTCKTLKAFSWGPNGDRGN